MVALQEIAGKHGLAIVEDCAQSLGSTTDKRNCGTFSTASAFSFYPTKNLGGYGDGGGVLTNDQSLAENLGMMRYYGQNSSGECVLQGLNSRLDELQAALLSERLKIIESQNKEKVSIARRYDTELDFLNPVPSRKGRVVHLYVVRPTDRDSFRNFLMNNKISTGIHYAQALTEHTYLRERGIVSECPVAQQTCSRVVSLPCFPGMTEQQVNKVINVCNAWRNQGA
jgi:dTDP-4-amino-4,6-dideoxygalactose transaminase